MVLQDPPIIMELELPGQHGKITWVDVANYGLDSSAMFGDDNQAATRVATWFCGAAADIKSLGDAGWQNTAGSQAMHLFRSTYLDAQILSHTEPKACALESAALFGGRCECYRIGEVAGPVHLLDIRSMYPYLCATVDVPVRLCRILERPELAALPLDLPGTFCIASVLIETDSPDYPYRHNNEIRYPVGRFSTCLSGRELSHAASAGVVRRVRRAALYESEPVLKRYAEALYRLRQIHDAAGDKTQSAYIKRLLVAIVGKFAQQERSWHDMPDAENAFEWGEWYSKSSSGESERWRSVAGHIQREYIGGMGHGSVGAISCAITSAGRNRLRKAMDVAGREHVFYCDTDAIICDDYALESLTVADWLRPGEWGYLQRVESADKCIIFGDKYYQIGGRSRRAGAPRQAAGMGGEDIGAAVQPWIGWSMRHQQRPADWSESHPIERGEGRYDRIRAAGGVVSPMEIWEDIDP